MHIHFIIHEHFEAPGAYEIWGKSRGCSLSYTRVYQGEPLPEELGHTDLLIIMGGPQSPATTREECPWFDAQAEKALISRAIEAGKTVIGVCLGSQLIGEALGAAFCHSPEKEIGTFPVRLTDAGKANPLFEGFGSVLNVGHWHNDMPGLTPQAKVLAYSEGCPRQIVQYSERVYGFQCHMELTPEVVELLIEHSQNDLRRAGEFRFVETAEKLRSHDYREMNQVLFSFLDKLTA
ncbi:MULTISPECIES: type 1 glutamine amidotransferase [Enterobacter]|jgi:GMP synthase (glutamine-hydrolysing)|uniref:type 1 glutamine amidotransferase n=1 Tax=Enterobacter TaxID=547 RepID=UPI0005EEDD7F|nr:MULTISPECIES: type 1 glutamine amidotransferase [Enterobacter]ELN9577635.1 type 1 glutamine amidotransferase [Enterobacter roggenkampii]KJM55010.1 glutamine amidotransferase [Enterobacter roggenkampii]KTI24347.1 glutamine amidotransferase [Enterobacter roggenkampii]MBO4172880.1 type 1 glutamine amidotransferase [Enterobacter roggenkampii]MCK6714369.1 type 1 glutamine amidotransferase [Enterobacter roggenkampii]